MKAILWLLINLIGSAAIITLLLLWMASKAHSQTELILDQVIVLGSRIDSLSPITVSQYPIDRKTGEDPSLFLSSTPGMYSYSDMGNFQGYSYIRLRGVDQTRINFTLDGIPLNESEDQGVYFSNYADLFSSVDHIQIQRGTAISYGSASYVGSVNFESPKLFGNSQFEISGTIGSFDTYRGVVRYDNGLNNGWGFHARTSAQSSSGFRNGMYNKSLSAFVSGGKILSHGILKLINFTGNQKNKLGWLGSSLENLANDRRHNQNINEHDNFTQSLTGLSYLSKKLSTTVYFNYLKGNYDFNLNRFLYDDLAEENPVYNYALQHKMFGAFFIYRVEGKVSSNITAHANFFKRNHDGYLSGLHLYGNYGLKHEQSLSVKNQFKWFYGEVQYRHVNFGYVGDVQMNNLDWNFVNYKVGINYHKFYYSFGSTGREPSRTDLFGGEDNLIELSPVVPERNFDHELGFKAKRFLINAYYMDFKNELTFNGQFGPNTLPIKSNVAKSRRYGIEGEYRDSLITFSANLSNNIIEQNNVRFHHILSPSVLLYGALHPVISGIYFEINSRYQSLQYLDFANENFIKGFATFGAEVSLLFSNFNVGLQVRNLFNQKGFSYGHLNVNNDPVYVSNASTNFLIQIKYKL